MISDIIRLTINNGGKEIILEGKFNNKGQHFSHGGICTHFANLVQIYI